MLFYSVLKLLNPSGGINKLALSGIKGVTLAADFCLYLLLSGAYFKAIAASTLNRGFWMVGRMYGLFHNSEAVYHCFLLLAINRLAQ